MTPAVTDLQLRQLGFSPAARNYPLSERAYKWRLRYNCVPLNWPVSPAWHYSSNEYMRAWTEALAEIDCPITAAMHNQRCPTLKELSS